MRHVVVLFLGLSAVHATPTMAQDSIPPGDGVRIGITYTPGVRPGMLMLSGDRSGLLDSVRTMIDRDLGYSSEFEMIALPSGDETSVQIRRSGPTATPADVNYQLFSALGAAHAVDVYEDASSGEFVVTVFDVLGETVLTEFRRQLPDPGSQDFRLNVHQLADEVVLAATGRPGIAATRLLFVSRGRIHRVDMDGADLATLSQDGVEALSPTWSPDGRRALYMEFPGQLFEHTITTGGRQLIPPTTEAQNFTPTYAPDGQTIAFARAASDGTDIYTYNLADQCCLKRLTVGKLFDNLSPTYSPDGRQIAFVTDRPGAPQVYVMSSDGSDQRLFAPFDWGVTGSSNAPEWSPDGLHIAFHREVDRKPQIFVMEVGPQRVRQLTAGGRSTDPTWAPDGRHLAFVSDRSGPNEIWIIDIHTGETRQITRMGEARLPSWSARIERDR